MNRSINNGDNKPFKIIKSTLLVVDCVGWHQNPYRRLYRIGPRIDTKPVKRIVRIIAYGNILSWFNRRIIDPCWHVEANRSIVDIRRKLIDKLGKYMIRKRLSLQRVDDEDHGIEIPCLRPR